MIFIVLIEIPSSHVSLQSYMMLILHHHHGYDQLHHHHNNNNEEVSTKTKYCPLKWKVGPDEQGGHFIPCAKTLLKTELSDCQTAVCCFFFVNCCCHKLFIKCENKLRYSFYHKEMI